MMYAIFHVFPGAVFVRPSQLRWRSLCFCRKRPGTCATSLKGTRSVEFLHRPHRYLDQNDVPSNSGMQKLSPSHETDLDLYASFVNIVGQVCGLLTFFQVLYITSNQEWIMSYHMFIVQYYSRWVLIWFFRREVTYIYIYVYILYTYGKHDNIIVFMRIQYIISFDIL